MEEFSVMFIAGLAIMAVFLVAFNTNGFAVSQQTATVNSFLTKAGFSDKEIQDSTFVGTNYTNQFIPFNFPFEVNNLPQTQTTEIGSREISNGILFGEKSVRYTLDKGNSITLKFRVDSTNALSPLVFMLNSQEVAKADAREGIQEIFINQSFEKGSIFEITAASSNWKIWAPSLYKIEGLSINVNSVRDSIDQYVFSVGDEYDTLQGGRMDLYLKDNVGTLVVALNGKTIFNGISRDYQPIRFSSTDLAKGQNIMTFTAAPDSHLRGDATMVLFYKQGTEKNIMAVINLTQTEQENLKSGTIRFDITDVKQNGGVAVRIVQNGGTTFSTFARAETGSYSFDFHKEDVSPGVSTIVIDQLDGASFLVRNLDVKIQKNWWAL